MPWGRPRAQYARPTASTTTTTTSAPATAAHAAESPRALAQATRRTHLAYLDGVRGYAALFVVAAHAYMTIWPLELGTGPAGREGSFLHWLLYSHFAICLFIVLSGFCLSLAVVRDGKLRGGARRFFRGRIRRILPTYYAAVALALLLIWTAIGDKTGTHWDISIPVTWHGFLSHVLLAQNLWTSPNINHVFWSVSAECQVYLFFPLLVLVWRRVGVGTATLLSLALSAIAIEAVREIRIHNGALLNVASPAFIALFGFGMLAAAIAYADRPALVRVRERVPWLVVATLATVLLVYLCMRWSRVDALVWRISYLDLVMGIATAAFLLACSRPDRRILGPIVSWRPMAVLGAFSYSIYLVHAPLLQLEWQYAIDRFDLSANHAFLLIMLVGVPLTIPAAYAFHLLAEKPFMSSRQKRAAEGEFVEDAAGVQPAAAASAAARD